MGREVHEVRVGGALIGHTAYCATSDMWLCAVEATPAEVMPTSAGLTRYCEARPRRGDERLGHTAVWASVSDMWSSEAQALLYCPACRSLIPPPHDGDDYEAYPAAWTAEVRP